MHLLVAAAEGGRICRKAPQEDRLPLDERPAYVTVLDELLSLLRSQPEDGKRN